MPAGKPAPDADPAGAPHLDDVGPTGDAMLRMAAVHTACLVISDAAHSLRRMSLVFEAAATAALVRSLQSDDPDAGSGSLRQAEQTMGAALNAFQATTAAAIVAARTGPPSVP